MKYPTESAIENHYLESILPHPTYPEPKQFLKTKQFYQPQKFIWNNPHRASEQMYKFYHKYNDHYLYKKEPLVKKQEQRDRQQAQMQRIQRLIAFRNDTRERFISKQHSRELLQTKIKGESQASTRGIKIDQNIFATQSKYKSHSSVRDQPFLTNTNLQQKNTERINILKQTYQRGLEKYDIKTAEISDLIQQQNQQFHRKIRSQFIVRKNVNHITNSKIHQNLKNSQLQRQY